MKKIKRLLFSVHGVVCCLFFCLPVCLVTYFLLATHRRELCTVVNHGLPFWGQYFRTKRDGNTPTGTPLTGASNAGGVGRNRNSEPVPGFSACF